MSLDQKSLDQLFNQARTHNAWQDKPVSADTLAQLYDLLKWAPTSANCSPARFVFVQSADAKARLKPAMSEANLAKTMSAPVTVIVGQDMAFYEHLPTLFPHTDAKSWFVGDQEKIESTAFRNSSLQGAYLILAARALGLDCGPMSGFDPEKINQTFFADSSVRANFLINLGYGDPKGLHTRGPRLPFDVACRIE